MNVALIHHQYVLTGGIERRLVNYTRELTRLGHQVTVITSKVDPRLPLPEGARILRADVSRVPKPIRKPFFNRRVGRIMVAERFDLSVALGRTAHQDAYVCGGTHRGFLRAAGRRIPGPRDLIDLALERRAYRSSQVIFAASGMIRDELVNFYHVPPEKVSVLHPPVDVERFRPELKERQGELRARFALPADRTVLVMVSTGHKRKGLELMRQVAASLPRDRYLLAVAGTRFQSSNAVQSLGFVDAVEDLYAAADCTVLPSVYEPFGQVVSESIQCGTPVLISHMVGAKEVVGPQEGRVLDSFEPTVWREAVRALDTACFRPRPDFARHHGLTISDHVACLLERGLRARGEAPPSGRGVG